MLLALSGFLILRVAPKQTNTGPDGPFLPGKSRLVSGWLCRVSQVDGHFFFLVAGRGASWLRAKLGAEKDHPKRAWQKCLLRGTFLGKKNGCEERQLAGALAKPLGCMWLVGAARTAASQLCRLQPQSGGGREPCLLGTPMCGRATASLAPR